MNYVQTLWYLEVPVRTFLGAKPDFGEVHFENYYFVRSTLPEDTQITFLLREGDQSLCEDADITDRYDDWIIGTCH